MIKSFFLFVPFLLYRFHRRDN